MDARLKFSRLIGVLCAGEELAARVALSQSRLAPVPWMRRALEAQARQERGHARLGARCLVALTVTGQDQAVVDYAGVGLETARAVADLLEDSRVDADGFWREVAARLAGWRRAAGLPA